jgi:hypothetical protein
VPEPFDANKQPEEIDWASIRAAAVNLSEVIWTYHQSLIAAGFTAEDAMALTLSYQSSMLP